MTDVIDLLLDAVQVAYDEEAPNEALRSPFIEHVEKIRAEERFKCKTAIQLQLDSNEEARKDERAKVLSEVEGWVEETAYGGGTENPSTWNMKPIKPEEILAKLNQLKGTK